MGTTLTAATVDEQGAHLGHVGDSRAYLLRAGALRQLTDDHTLVNRMVKAGEITPQEAGVHPHRNVLTRSIGTEPEVDVDEDDVPLIDGDRLLLCSDGLTGMVTEPQIQAILEADAGPARSGRPARSKPPTAPAASTTSRWSSSTSTKVTTQASTTAGGAAASRRADPEERSREAASTAIVGPQRRRRPSSASIKKWSIRIGVVVARGAGGVLRDPRLHRSAVVRGRGRGQGRRVSRGSPRPFGGVHFSHVALETDIPAAEVAQAAAVPGALRRDHGERSHGGVGGSSSRSGAT